MRRSSYMAPGVFESDFGPAHYERILLNLGMDAVKTRWEGAYWIYGAHRLLRFLRRLLRPLDGTVVAAGLGWYFMVSAVKPALRADPDVMLRRPLERDAGKVSQTG